MMPEGLKLQSARGQDPSVERTIDDLAEIGAMVAARRKTRGLSQQDFADLAGVGRRFVSELERGKPTAEIGKTLRVLNTLGLDLVIRSR
ncbi:helix-turn-helix transcriptional regulator [Pelagibacterium lentulum]|uniref:HTH cro/C1-type domain-containing protein n=1 Tax=Pelagibacterium lentulum TaxID=2029865 RepID=A0A916RFV4_9HYPH|nr:helix-turn-helix transcriptional regulator [Pelagibacterium lentulum]GGA54395.1 hypothetical protein GCM10011499_25710 [Pelagibacterium lentulum]